MLRLILGRSGTGKSEIAANRAADAARAGRRVLLIVPEQFSFETELRFCDSLTGPASLNLSVLSFTRLSENIFRACGGLAVRRLTDPARLVLMRLAVDELSDTLRIYASQAGKSAFLTAMLEMVRSFKQSGLSPADVERLSEESGDAQLSGKLKELSALYAAYQALVERTYADPLDDISRAARLASENRFFADTQVFVDGFSFFSPPERELLVAAMEQADLLTVTLCTDKTTPEEDGREDVFYLQKLTALRLLAAARERGISVLPAERLSENLRCADPVLRDVQDLAAGERPDAPCGEAGGLRLLRAADPYAELRCVSAEIVRLVREEGWRYRDFAIVCRNIGEYRTAVQAMTDAYGIPVFLERTEAVFTKPVTAFLTAALRAACTLSSEAVLRVARSPASGLTAEQAARLENYAYVWSVRGEGWLWEFQNDPEGLDGGHTPQQLRAEIEDTRRRVIRPLARLRERIAACDGTAFAGAVYEYVQETGALDNLCAFFENGDAQDFARLQENDRLWEYIVDILDLFSEALGSKRRTAAELTGLFELAMAQATLGNIPASNDQVIADAADSMRLASPRGVFVVGAADGVFPAAVHPGGLFTRQERERLSTMGVEMVSPLYQQIMQERFYFYSALSAPRERLWISCPETDFKGAPIQPAAPFEELWACFPAARTDAGSISPLDSVCNPETARAAYARTLAESGEERATLREYLRRSGDGPFLAELERIADGSAAENLTPQTARALCGTQMRLSPSRIETFYQCPYRYFCNYMMKLSPRRRVAYTSLSSGTAVHYVFETLLKRHGAEGVSQMDDGALLDAVSALLTEYIDGLAADNAALSARFRYQFLRLRDTLTLILRHIGDEFGQSCFTAVGLEVPVGEGGEVVPADLEAPDGTKVSLVGKIDRVDRYEDAAGSYIRVVDYKSGGKKFELSDVSFGLNMQMLIYLFAVCADRSGHFTGSEPAGILYMPGSLSPVSAAGDAAREEALRPELEKELTMNGLLLDDEQILRAMERGLDGKYIPVTARDSGELKAAAGTLSSREGFKRLRDTVQGHIREMARALRAGEISPRPFRKGKKTACDWCDYGRLCGNCGGPVFRDVRGGEEESHG